MQKMDLMESSFQAAVEKYKNHYINIWRNSDSVFPCIETVYTRKDQLKKEKQLDTKIKKITKELKSAPISEEKKIVWREKIKWAMREIGGSALGFKDDEMSSRVIDEFSGSANDFIKEAKLFNPDISLADVNQAIRNLWIANSIQILLDKKAGLTPALFAYSMLYPYTDNFLDDPRVSGDQKKQINIRFRDRLAGENIQAKSGYEDALFRLVEMIESEYPRASFQCVYDSLLGIHKAQEKSLLQHNAENIPNEIDILDISFEKGGTSVLADAFLADGNLSWGNADFMFGFGVFLQLIDDIEDSSEDLRNGHMTIFSRSVGKRQLDGITNSLFHFIDAVLKTSESNELPNLGKLKDIIRNNSYFLILEAIAKNSRAYSSHYVKEMEKFSPYSFSYMIKMKKKLKKQYHSFDLKKIDLSHFQQSV